MNDQHGDAGIEIGTFLEITLGGDLATVELSFPSRMLSAQDVRHAMNENTTVTCLHVMFQYSIDADPLGFVQFLLQYIVSRTHLRELFVVDPNGPALRRFLMAAAGSESINHLGLTSIFQRVSVLDLNEFCCANRNIKTMEFSDSAFFLPDETDLRANAPGHLSSTIPQLDMLIFERTTFSTRPAALMFLNSVVPCLKTTGLRLSSLRCDFDGGEAMTTRIVSSLFGESMVKRLHLGSRCSPGVFSTALATGKTSVERLSVDFGKLEDNLGTFVKALPDMARVKILHMFFLSTVELQPDIKKQLFRAVDACVALEEIRVFRNIFSPQEVQLLQEGRVQRNNELRRFVATPTDYPAKDLLKLMLQLENCPTGRFQLARNLPKEYFQGRRKRFLIEHKTENAGES